MLSFQIVLKIIEGVWVSVTIVASDRARTETRAFRMVASAADWSIRFLFPLLLLLLPEGGLCLETLLGFPQALDSDSGLSSLPSNLFPVSRGFEFSRSKGGDPERSIVLSSDDTSASCSTAPEDGPRSMNCLGTMVCTSCRLLPSALPSVAYIYVKEIL